jgi:O-antigen/teichoic acid export membrane protein
MIPAEEETPRVRRTVGSGAAVTTVASLATTAAGGLLGILMARILGPADMGSYTLASTTLFVLLTVASLGIQAGTTYYVGGRGWPPAEAFDQLQIASLVVGAVVSAIGAVLAVLLSDSLFRQLSLTDLLPVLIALPFALSWTFTMALALAVDAYETAAMLPLLSVAGALVLATVLALADGLQGAILGLALGHVLATLLGWAWRRRRLDRPAHGWVSRTWARLRRATLFGGQVQFPQVLQLVCYRGDLFVLNAVAAASTVGHYAVALTLSEVGMVLPRALAAVILPRIADLDASGEADHQNMVVTKSVRHTLVLIPVICVALVIGNLLIPLVFGADYKEAVGPGLILVPGVAGVGLASVLAATVIGRGMPRYQVIVAVTVTPPTLLLYGLLIPAWEAYGAAIASTASYLAGLGVTWWGFKRVTGLGLRDVLPRRDDLADYGALLRRARRRAISSW